jgi:hypothetical protein
MYIDRPETLHERLASLVGESMQGGGGCTISFPKVLQAYSCTLGHTGLSTNMYLKCSIHTYLRLT